MFKEYYTPKSARCWEKEKPKRYHTGRKEALSIEMGFVCRQCQAYVTSLPVLSGVQNRNHCPLCLWSRHVDHIKPGDRMSACKASMQPIGLTVKQTHDKYGCCKNGELMLIHRCSQCGKISINRIAADDLTEGLMGVFYASFELDQVSRNLLEFGGIHLLDTDDTPLVIRGLQGIQMI